MDMGKSTRSGLGPQLISELVLLKSVDLRLWVLLGAHSPCCPILLPQVCVLLA